MKQQYLITGGAGFIGSHLAEFLLKQGNAVIVLDNFSTGTKHNLAECFKNEDFRCISGDARDAGLVENAAEGCDVIIHLAASVGVRKILADPAECMENNLQSTQAVIQAAMQNKSKLFLASSSEVYGKLLKDVLSESDGSFLGSTEYSRWSYATAKLIDEHLALAYFRQGKLDVVIGRFFNVAGPRQSDAYGMVIPRFISQALRGEPLSVYNDGVQTRTFCSVHDVVRAISLLCNSDNSSGQVVNIGSDEGISILQLARNIIEITQSSSPIGFISEKDLPSGFDDILHRCPDLKKIHSLAGWKPEIPLQNIIKDAVLYAQSQIIEVNNQEVESF